ncbi:hypothetical protein SAMN05421743_102372 [Thalassobacillus cyri]|uniref:Uncharacterized protein n=1 Tax=Thalassobacillus cyri TaxID=571932 RepID=A0A1H3Y6G7_9BACI|nr:hypothetical protein [Thalassobacillus cyri]SEA07215.1 hypothetical protein SAMN05421743_102372 [Thalassobacillus cyri]
MWYKNKSYWIFPLIIFLAGAALLFFENLQKVTEPADERVSRSWKIGETPLRMEPFIYEKDDGYIVSYFHESSLMERTYDEEWELQSEHQYAIDYKKFSRVFNNGETLIYTDSQTLFHGKEGEKLAEIDGFFPVQNHAFYLQENRLVHLNPDTMQSKNILELDNTRADVYIKETDEGLHILTVTPGNSTSSIKVYQLGEQHTTELLAAKSFPVKSGETVREVAFDVQESKLGLMIGTLQKQSVSGTPEYHYYYAAEDFKGSKLSLQTVKADDPFSHGSLKEWSDLQFSLDEDGAKALFVAHGATKTTYRDTPAFNIYELQITENQSKVTRMSNTPERSLKPSRAGVDNVLWIDAKGEANEINVASRQEALLTKAAGYKQADFISALGKTVGMFSYAPFTFFITFMWYLWPFLFIFLMMGAFGGAVEEGKRWVMYTALGLYLLSTLIWNDMLFSEKLMARMPEYLNFQGSTWLLLTAFAVIAYLLMEKEGKWKDWGIPMKFTYFVGIHLLLVTVFIGPYLL